MQNLGVYLSLIYESTNLSLHTSILSSHPILILLEISWSEKVEFFKSFKPLLYPVVNKVIKLSCTTARALDQSIPTIGILEVSVLYLLGYFISGSSGTVKRKDKILSQYALCKAFDKCDSHVYFKIVV